ncbi:MAG: methionine--tRNA ligase subunit beta, partial [Pseudoruminococcus massiliensis]
MKTVWINRVRKREVKSGYKILSLEILMMKPLNDVNKGNDVKNQPVEEMKAEPEKIDFSKVKVEPLFEEMVDFDTFSKSDFRAVKVKECVAVPKSKKLLQFTLDDGTGTDRTILSGIHSFY